MSRATRTAEASDYLQGSIASPPAGYSRSQWWTLGVAALSVLLIGWAAFYIVAGGEGFALAVSDKLRGEEEAISAVARIFAALVLWLFSTG